MFNYCKGYYLVLFVVPRLSFCGSREARVEHDTVRPFFSSTMSGCECFFPKI